MKYAATTHKTSTQNRISNKLPIFLTLHKRDDLDERCRNQGALGEQIVRMLRPKAQREHEPYPDMGTGFIRSRPRKVVSLDGPSADYDQDC